MSTPTTDAQHARAIVQIINEHVALERETNVRITDHIEAYFTDKVSRPDDAALREIQSLKDQISNMERNFNAANTAKDPAGTGPQMDKMAAELRKAVQERDEAKARHSDLAERVYPEIEKLRSELETVRATLHIVTRERDAGTSDYTRLLAERDALVKAGQASEAKVRELVAEKPAGWMKFSDRKPTVKDSDVEGHILVTGECGQVVLHPWGSETNSSWPFWRPVELPFPVPPFVRWKRSLTDRQVEDFGSVYNLDRVWKSITNFIQTNPSHDT